MSERIPVIDASARWRISLGALISVVTATALGAAAITWLRSDVATARSDISVHELQIRLVETRLRALEAAQIEIAVMKNDVQWIRRSMEERKD